MLAPLLKIGVLVKRRAGRGEQYRVTGAGALLGFGQGPGQVMAMHNRQFGIDLPDCLLYLPGRLPDEIQAFDTSG